MTVEGHEVDLCRGIVKIAKPGKFTVFHVFHKKIIIIAINDAQSMKS